MEKTNRLPGQPSIVTDGETEAADEATFEGVSADAGIGGRRAVITLYLLLVGVAVVMGVVLSVILEDATSVALFGLIELPPTALGMALYGGITVATLLGIPLLGIWYISNRGDE